LFAQLVRKLLELSQTKIFGQTWNRKCKSRHTCFRNLHHHPATSL